MPPKKVINIEINNILKELYSDVAYGLVRSEYVYYDLNTNNLVVLTSPFYSLKQHIYIGLL